VDFSQTIIIMTSNLGAKEMNDLITGSIGFAPARAKELVAADVDKKIYHTALDAAKRKFSPEFMNRIDKVVVFRSLREKELGQILELELGMVQHRVNGNRSGGFVFDLTDDAKHFLLEEGTDYQYGARHLKRAVERLLVHPLSSLVASGQVQAGDFVSVDLNRESGKLAFYGERSIPARPAVAAAFAVDTGRLAA